MKLEQWSVGPFQCNCTLLTCEQTGESVLIDPGDEAERIIASLQSRGLRPKYLLHTHAHLDHVGGTLGIQEQLGGESCLHEEDLFLFENVALQAALFHLPTPRTGKIDQFLHDGDILNCGREKIQVLHTPGHTPGSLSFLIEGQNSSHLFTGDTLFAGSIGRTDLWGGDFQQILHSIKNKILPLHSATVIHAGHGPNSTLERERQKNPFLLEYLS